MIWNEQKTSWDNALATSLCAEIRQACSGGAGLTDAEQQWEVARSVAFHAAREHERTGVLPAGYLALLAARALWAVGESEAARRLIALKSEELGFPTKCADAVFHSDIPLQIWWTLLSLRAVRPSGAFESARGKVWSLDLSRTFCGERDCLELMAFRVTNAIVQAIAPLWDESAGQGALALRNVRAVASSLLRGGRKDRKTMMLASEIRRLCSRKFRVLRESRGWTDCPVVLSLD